MKAKMLKSKLPMWFIVLYKRVSTFASAFLVFRPLSAKNETHTPFLIIGSGRSGNTLLRSMLVGGGEVAIPPESYVWPRALRLFAAYSFLPWPQLASMVISEFSSYKRFFTWNTDLSEAHIRARALSHEDRNLANIINEIYFQYISQQGLEVKRWGEKTPINTLYIEKIQRVFPKAKYLHIVRDPRDVVCSYIKAGFYTDKSDALSRWEESIKKAHWLKRNISPTQYHEVRYEDLVSNPERELQQICSFLDLTFKAEMLSFKNARALGDVAVEEHHRNIQRPLTTDSIGKWKKMLLPEEATAIEKRAGVYMAQYGYL